MCRSPYHLHASLSSHRTPNTRVRPLVALHEPRQCPNSCTPTYQAIKATNLCHAYYGSLRSFIDDNAAAHEARAVLPGAEETFFRPRHRHQYGLIYLDYCSTLSAGISNRTPKSLEAVEKSPREDIRQIFRVGTSAWTKTSRVAHST